MEVLEDGCGFAVASRSSAMEEEMSSDARARRSNVVKLSAWRRRPYWQPEPWRWWFAWRPVRVDGTLVWLRWVAWRKVRRTYPSRDLLGEFHPWQIEYALRPSQESGKSSGMRGRTEPLRVR